MNVTAKDIELAKKGRNLLRSRSRSRVRLGIGTEDPIDLPGPAKRMLEQTLSYLAEGKSVVVLAEPAELSTQEAADILRVSRPYLVKLVESGQVPFRRVGKHRRLLTEDVLAYKARLDDDRLKTLEKLAEESQELGLGY